MLSPMPRFGVELAGRNFENGLDLQALCADAEVLGAARLEEQKVALPLRSH